MDLSSELRKSFKNYLTNSQSGIHKFVLNNSTRNDTVGGVSLVPFYYTQDLIRKHYQKTGFNKPEIGNHPDFSRLVDTNELVNCSITTLFMDMEGSTKLGLKYSPKEVFHIKNAFIKTAMEVVKAFDGHVHRIMGDAVMAFFGGINASEEDSVINALNCASILMWFAKNVVSEELKYNGYNDGFGIRVGIDWAKKEDIVWGSYGYPGMNEITATSFNVDSASKLQHAANRNNVMIGSSLKEFLDIPDDFCKNEGTLTANYTKYCFLWEDYLKLCPIPFKIDENNKVALLFESNVQKSLSKTRSFVRNPEMFEIKISYSNNGSPKSFSSCSYSLNKNATLTFEINPQSIINLGTNRTKAIFRIENHGKEASQIKNNDNHESDPIFIENMYGSKILHQEQTKYRGLHYVEVDLIQNENLISRKTIGVYIS